MAFFHAAVFADARQTVRGQPEQQERLTIPGTTPALNGNGNGKRKIVRISTSGDCHYHLNGSATSTSEPLFERQVEHIDIDSGDTIDIITLVP